MIGISYTGANGRQRKLNISEGGNLDEFHRLGGGISSGSVRKGFRHDAAPLVREDASTRAPQNFDDTRSANPPSLPAPSEAAAEMSKESGKVKLNQNDKAGYLAEKVDGRGSVSVGLMGLQLRGDDNAPTSGGSVMLYSLAHGMRGWQRFAQIDPAVIGANVCPSFGSNSIEEDQSEIEIDETKPFSFDICSRIATKQDDAGVFTHVYAFFRQVSCSGMGRIVKIGGERRQDVGVFFTGSPSACQYGVRAYFTDAVGTGIREGTQVLTHLAFGLSSDLERLPDEFSLNPDEEWDFIPHPLTKDGDPLYVENSDGTVSRLVNIVPVMPAAAFYGFEGRNTLADSTLPE